MSILLLILFSNAAYAAGEGSKEEKLQISKTLSYVANLSREPEAVKFRNITTAGFFSCGEVNFKNSKGGYIGYVKFSSREESDFQAIGLRDFSIPFDCVKSRRENAAAETMQKNATTAADKAAADKASSAAWKKSLGL